MTERQTWYVTLTFEQAGPLARRAWERRLADYGATVLAMPGGIEVTLTREADDPLRAAVEVADIVGAVVDATRIGVEVTTEQEVKRRAATAHGCPSRSMCGVR